jgi:hypothetical protein
MQDTAKTVALRSWIDRKHFPVDDYCQKIDDAREFLMGTAAADDATVSDDQIVAMIAMMLDNEGALVAYCLDNDVEITDAENWLKICQAAAWVLLQRYELRVKKGEWPA